MANFMGSSNVIFDSRGYGDGDDAYSNALSGDGGFHLRHVAIGFCANKGHDSNYNDR